MRDFYPEGYVHPAQSGRQYQVVDGEWVEITGIAGGEVTGGGSAPTTGMGLRPAGQFVEGGRLHQVEVPARRDAGAQPAVSMGQAQTAMREGAAMLEGLKEMRTLLDDPSVQQALGQFGGQTWADMMRAVDEPTRAALTRVQQLAMSDVIRRAEALKPVSNVDMKALIDMFGAGGVVPAEVMARHAEVMMGQVADATAQSSAMVGFGDRFGDPNAAVRGPDGIRLASSTPVLQAARAEMDTALPPHLQRPETRARLADEQRANRTISNVEAASRAQGRPLQGQRLMAGAAAAFNAPAPAPVQPGNAWSDAAAIDRQRQIFVNAFTNANGTDRGALQAFERWRQTPAGQQAMGQATGATRPGSPASGGVRILGVRAVGAPAAPAPRPAPAAPQRPDPFARFADPYQ